MDYVEGLSDGAVMMMMMMMSDDARVTNAPFSGL